jgi:hypothetical protein
VVGGTLFAVDAGSLIGLAAVPPQSPWETAWFVVGLSAAGLVAVVGLYVLLALYIGLPLPETRAARGAAPDFRIESISIVRVYKTRGAIRGSSSAWA